MRSPPPSTRDAAEIASVSDDDVTVTIGTRVRRHDGLEPDRAYAFDGVTARTLPRPGELLTTIATTNDVHFGEQMCGVIEGTDMGPTFSVVDAGGPYPEIMNGGAVAEIGRLDPAAVVVKGDLTSRGHQDEYQRFLEHYEGAFGDRLLHVRGNHDSYHGGTYAAWPTQERTLDGVVIALLDTSRLGRANGSLSADQIEWLDELGARADRPVMVFGHHHVWVDGVDPRSDTFFGLVPGDTEALVDVFARRPRLVGYFCGHTHRNRRVNLPATGEVPFVEVACVKDFPGSWAEYRVFDGGILQIHRRIGAPDAMKWSELTRGMYEGSYERYALGKITDRCFLIRTDR